jgi:hypothetical protein
MSSRDSLRFTNKRVGCATHSLKLRTPRIRVRFETNDDFDFQIRFPEIQLITNDTVGAWPVSKRSYGSTPLRKPNRDGISNGETTVINHSNVILLQNIPLWCAQRTLQNLQNQQWVA